MYINYIVIYLYTNDMCTNFNVNFIDFVLLLQKLEVKPWTWQTYYADHKLPLCVAQLGSAVRVTSHISQHSRRLTASHSSTSHNSTEPHLSSAFIFQGSSGEYARELQLRLRGSGSHNRRAWHVIESHKFNFCVVSSTLLWPWYRTPTWFAWSRD